MPPRLHVLHRPDTTLNVILRTGTQKKKKVSAAFGWDWKTDKIVPGQWIGGRVYPFECDMSPDGQWMYYNALNAKWDDPATLGCFGALSRAPYFKAVALWAVGSRWMSSRLIQCLHPNKKRIVDVDDPTPEEFSEKFYLSTGSYNKRLLRDGWKKTGTESHQGPPNYHGEPTTNTIHTYSISICGHARLERLHHKEPLGPRPFRYDTHAIVDTGGDRYAKPGWQWAQVDKVRNRLLWAEDGRLWAGQIGRRGLPQKARLLHDFNGMRFQRRLAPY